ncbi:hypothetical protein [Actinomadura alba]|uniref:Uncharacterized protein n=1 Tax=Actinomadura alba TaxID=406431 RepID=A0ABR7LQC8_9ACTN|nr:hypothetical protein [Actinomadura alba]MBC6467057.1 hypothetical protein [Actinomadura alba]
MSYWAVTGERPSSARAVRVLLNVAAGLTAMVALQAWMVVGGARGVGVAVVFLLPALAGALAAWRSARPGRWLWWGVVALEVFYLVWQIGRLPAGDPFGLLGLAFPVAILILVFRRRCREWMAPARWQGLRSALRKGAGGDAGEGAVGYVAVLVLVAAVAVALAAVIPGSVSDGVKSAVCGILEESCPSPKSGQAVGPPAQKSAPTPYGRAVTPAPQAQGATSAPQGQGAPSAPPGQGATPAPPLPKPSPVIGLPHNFVPAEDYDARLNCWELTQGLCDLGQGIWLGGGDAYNSFADGVNMVACTAHIGCGRERFNETWDGWRQLVTTNPVDTVKSIWDESTKDIGNDWNQGQGWRSVGRTVPTVLSTIFGGKGINRLKSPNPLKNPVENVVPPKTAVVPPVITDVPPPKTGKAIYKTTDMKPGHRGEDGRGVVYLDDVELEKYRIVVRDGHFYTSDGRLLDTSGGGSHWSGAGNAIFVMDSRGNLYASPSHEVGRFHHSSFLRGGPVSGAGELKIENGVLVSISDKSGHYLPEAEYLQQVVQSLREQGVKIDPNMIKSWNTQ